MKKKTRKKSDGWKRAIGGVHVAQFTIKGHAVPDTDDFLRTAEWRRLRMKVIKKYGARCQCCGASPTDGVTQINVDHIKPRKLFPELALDENNLQVLCGACNHGKGNWDMTDWRTTTQDDQYDPAAELMERLRAGTL